MSIEGFLVINLAADFSLLASVSRAMGLFSWRRVLAADAVCATLAVLAALEPGLELAAALACPALAALIITRRAAPRLWALSALALLGQALLCGGIARLIALPRALSIPLCLGSGALLTLLVNAGRSPGSGNWQVSLCLRVGNRCARFPALIDTGNRLREPLSGLPVLVAQAQLVRDILPDAGYRTLGFGGLGGEGRMACFRPDALWIGSGRKRCRGPDVWVAVSPRPLPGLCQALAPPEFANYYRV
jgi:stage II sporulation protein GA (sporulation sigma-E factor processing peptidase)